MENQNKIRVNPLPSGEHLKFKDIVDIPESTWYAYTLRCEHVVYSKVRIKAPRDYSFMEHYIRCPVGKHEPLNWQAITKMEAASDEHVRNVRSATSFVLPNRILRCDGHTPNGGIHNSGNPFPYSVRDRDY